MGTAIFWIAWLINVGPIRALLAAAQLRGGKKRGEAGEVNRQSGEMGLETATRSQRRWMHQVIMGTTVGCSSPSSPRPRTARRDDKQQYNPGGYHSGRQRDLRTF